MKVFRIFMVLLCLVPALSCNTKKDKDIACLDILLPEFINFKIVDKNTNADLFFGEQPAYATNQLKIYQHDKPVTFAVKTDAANGSYFQVQVQIAYANIETLQIKTGDLPMQELTYTSTKVSDPCPRYPVSTVKFNNIDYTDVKGRVIVLKK